MVDLVALAMLVGFFVVAAAFVKACERIIGPDVISPNSLDTAVDAERDAA